MNITGTPLESKDSKGNDYFSGWFVSFIIMIKNNKILALKYRPQIFEDLIGQDIVADTILNSIKNNKIPNAYLFTGIRGVGKTTTARIIA